VVNHAGTPPSQMTLPVLWCRKTTLALEPVTTCIETVTATGRPIAGATVTVPV
jgi:hypothetical protein